MEVCFADTGGTFTDAFVVDRNGEFVAAKAPTTPDDVSKGYFSAMALAAAKRGLDLHDLYSQMAIVGYASTTAVNIAINRNGAKVGVILTKGFEQLMIMGRAKQSWLSYDIYDIIHARTHRFDETLVPYSLIKGATERVNSLGQIVIPLYENEVLEAANELVDKGVEAIVVCFLFSWMNAQHEIRARDIVRQVAKSKGKDTAVYISSEVSAVIRELSRLNTAVFEAYVAPKVMGALNTIDLQLKEYGFKGSLQILQSAGGVTSVKTLKPVQTLESGPVGGLMGGLYIGQIYGFDNIITTDVGGTSFDVGLITDGMVTIEREPIVARMILGMPMIQINSIGAGGGTYVRTDPLTKRLQVGPGSAEAVPGPVCYDRGGEIPTITDCDLALGYIDPEYFLGGKSDIRINKDKAVQVLKEKVANPLGVDIAEAALGARSLLDTRMKDTIVGMVMSRGYSLSDYYLLAFGGAGPTHCAGYTDGLLLKGIMLFPYSAVFSAFGAAAADYQHTYYRATNIVIPAQAANDIIKRACDQLNKGWQYLEEVAYRDMAQEGFEKEKVNLRHLAMIRYGRQLDDLIVPSPKPRIESVEDWKELLDVFGKLYEKIYVRQAKYSQSGYEILEIGLVVTVAKTKPRLRRYEIGAKEPSNDARKGARECYFDHNWMTTQVYDWDKLSAGNVVSGAAIIEGSTSNIVLPPQKSIYVDEYLTVWLK
jgi:N-methylhydantoinase A